MKGSARVSMEIPSTDLMIIGIMLILATFAHHLFEN